VSSISVEQLRAAVANPPRGRVLEIGHGVLLALLVATMASPRSWREPLAMLAGIPFRECGDMEPGAWRLLEGGEVVKEGTL
jgi:hypothetical protein